MQHTKPSTSAKINLAIMLATGTRELPSKRQQVALLVDTHIVLYCDGDDTDPAFLADRELAIQNILAAIGAAQNAVDAAVYRRDVASNHAAIAALARGE